MKSLKSRWISELWEPSFTKECMKTFNNSRSLFLLFPSFSVPFPQANMDFNSGMPLILEIKFVQRDAFLITQNAMHFNSSTTIYFRQVLSPFFTF